MQAEGDNIIIRHSTQPIGWLIGASILFHVLMLLVFNQGFSIQAEKRLEKEPEKINKIRATLVFTPEMLAAELEPESKPKIEQSPVQEEQITPKDIPADEAPEVVVSEPLENEFVENKPAETETLETDTPELTKQDPAGSNPGPADENQPKYTAPTVVSRDLAKHHLNSYTQQRNQQMALEAARTYRQQRSTPDFPAANIDPYKTEEEKFQQSLQVKADCSSTTNKSVATLASLFGGNIQCSKPPPFQEFIDKRLNKQEAK
jgi:hypothetical protein